MRAALAGALSTAVAATAELIAGRAFPDASLERWTGFAGYWAIIGVATGFAALGEISFLYWDALHSVRRLAHAAGLTLSPGANRHTAAALARAALELPNRSEHVLGIDPRREASRLGLLVAALLYKVKVSATNFVVKALVRRALGRSAVRTFLPFVAIPVTASWNALVAFRALREARVRVMGPSFIEEALEVLFKVPPSGRARLCAFRAAGAAIVRTGDLHPNLLALVLALRKRLGEPPPGEVLDDPSLFLRELRSLDAAEKRIVLGGLHLAAIADGKLTRTERRLVLEAHEAVGQPWQARRIEELRRSFVSGEALPSALSDPKK